MTREDFIANLELSYKGKYSDPDVKEIKDFFIEHQINETGIHNLYNTIKMNYLTHQLPTFGHIVKYFSEKSQFISSNESGSLDRESPLQQLYKAKDWSVDKILKGCRFLRQKQDEVGTSGLKSWEISFIVIWERLKDVEPDFRGMAKSRILANGDKELSKPVNLDDLMPELKPIKISEERSGKTEHISRVLEDVF